MFKICRCSFITLLWYLFNDCVADLCLIFEVLNIDKAPTICQLTDTAYPSFSKTYRDKIMVRIMH